MKMEAGRRADWWLHSGKLERAQSAWRSVLILMLNALLSHFSLKINWNSVNNAIKSVSAVSLSFEEAFDFFGLLCLNFSVVRMRHLDEFGRIEVIMYNFRFWNNLIAMFIGFLGLTVYLTFHLLDGKVPAILIRFFTIVHTVVEVHSHYLFGFTAHYILSFWRCLS